MRRNRRWLVDRALLTQQSWRSALIERMSTLDYGRGNAYWNSTASNEECIIWQKAHGRFSFCPNSDEWTRWALLLSLDTPRRHDVRCVTPNFGLLL